MASIRENLNHGLYTTHLPYPDKPRKPVLKSGATSKEAREYADALAAWELGQEDFQAQRRAYYEDVNRLENQFREDLLAELGVADHPKAHVLWLKAWEQGHGSGLAEVLNVAEDLVDLLL